MCSIMGYAGPRVPAKKFDECFSKTFSRGPDGKKIVRSENGMLGFQRLSIMGLSPEGMQPFSLNSNYLVCNGEIYGVFEAAGDPVKSDVSGEMPGDPAQSDVSGEMPCDPAQSESAAHSASDVAVKTREDTSISWRKERAKLEKLGYTFKSQSDCEILLALYEEYGEKMFAMLDAEFALIIYDAKQKAFVAARDPIGIRPLYYGYDEQGQIVFASEPKCLISLVKEILPFPPGHYYKNGKFICYRDISKVEKFSTDGLETVCKKIHDKLVRGIEKRLDADAPVGFLLSGGLDSSLVCAVSAKILKKPIETYAIGMQGDAIDLKYAKEVADFIGSNHHEIIITREDVLSSLEEVIKILGSFDITTIRASMGMYLVCKAIHEQSNIRVLLTGEISDELFGYKYTDFAPNASEFQKEAEKRIRELHMYDVLRADRCISVNSLEARVPFGDLDFVQYVMSVDPELKMNHYNKGKYLLRHAFEHDETGAEYLPRDILMREKAAFSDAVGHSLVDDLKEYAESYYTDEEFAQKCKAYKHATPFTKESLLYREIFEKYYPGQSEMIKDFWMPNKAWKGCDVKDPSARVLSNYGDSGK